MSAPVLSPAEQAETARFGLHDEEIIAQLEQDSDDELTCEIAACSEPSTHVLVCEFCNGQTGTVCGAHAKYIQNSIREVQHVPCGTTDMLCLLVKAVPM